jgi:hypothetical protein
MVSGRSGSRVIPDLRDMCCECAVIAVIGVRGCDGCVRVSEVGCRREAYEPVV